MSKKINLTEPNYTLIDAAKISGLDLISFVQKCKELNISFLSGYVAPNSSLLYSIFGTGGATHRYRVNPEQVFIALSNGSNISYLYKQKHWTIDPLPDFSGDFAINELLIPLKGLKIIITPTKTRKERAEKADNEALVLSAFNELSVAQQAMCRKNGKIIANQVAKKIKVKTGLANSVIREKVKDLLTKGEIC